MHFEVRNEVKMLPLFLKCFPNIEKLHINSMEAFNPTGKVNFKFWQEASSIESVERRIKKLVIHGFQEKRSELTFLKFIAERAQVLEKMVLILSPKCFPSVSDVRAKLNPLTTTKWASKDFKVILFQGPEESGGGAAPFSFHSSADFSCNDPFDLVTVEDTLSHGAVFLRSSIN